MFNIPNGSTVIQGYIYAQVGECMPLCAERKTIYCGFHASFAFYLKANHNKVKLKLHHNSMHIHQKLF